MLADTHRVTRPTGAEEGVQRHPRALFSVPMTLRHLITGGVRTSHGITLDLSESGIGALVEGSLLVGDTVAIEFTLADQSLHAVAIVRHSSTARSGFEFLELSVEERFRIANVIGNC